MKKWILITLISVTAAWSLTAYVPSVQAAERIQAKEKKGCISPAAAKLTFDLRKLWIDHVVWTQSYMKSALSGLEDQERGCQKRDRAGTHCTK